MNDQPDLFPPFQRHSQTSFAAALEIEAPAHTLRRRVFDFLYSRQVRGATDDEIQIALDMNPSTQRPRRIELVNLGWVRDSGMKRDTISGRSATVWKVVGP